MRLLDSDDDITRKVRKAVTDTDGEMRYDRDKKAGLANLLEILAAATGRSPEGVASEYTRYGDLKNDVAGGDLRRAPAPYPRAPDRLHLESDRAYVDDVLARGAAHAHEVAAPMARRRTRIDRRSAELTSTFRHRFESRYTGRRDAMTTLANRPNTAVLVVDVQNGVVANAYARDAVVANIGDLVERARQEEIRRGCRIAGGDRTHGTDLRIVPASLPLTDPR